MSKRGAGSRFLYEPFDAAAARLETHEKVIEERWIGLERRLGQIETTLERLEKRLWLAVFGVVSFVLVRGVLNILEVANN
ncbi:hypothetical protein F9L33_04800 [Amylibacter sp. SFDW26]|uniref:GTA head formation protein, RCAP_rcc01685 family n=1 Tax=Amylibacter sp. SFDW26 TaxID=2652722 RepID=UPI001262A364|nr:hypothetical protein [Amylibacter sp. SFDW26]KAB7616084.1 hypothetical protein F9L33_04800 [Amylibacter sp. SFDW26]